MFNVFGDVTHLLDSTGNVVVEYRYDSYGNLEYKTPNSPLANANPYRYRSYRYDNETGYYYLQSRYYNPETGRFISADGLLKSSETTLGHNMYSYVNNNPIMFTDPTGFAWKWWEDYKAWVVNGWKAVGRWRDDVVDDIVENTPDSVANYIVEHFEVYHESVTPRCQGGLSSGGCGLYYRNIQMRWKDGFNIGSKVEMFGLVDFMKLSGDGSWKGILGGFSLKGVASAFSGRLGMKIHTNNGTMEFGLKGYYAGAGGEVKILHTGKDGTFTVFDISGAAWAGGGAYWRITPTN